MGTSASAKGTGRHQPLVPTWADDEPGQPLPEPQEQRHRQFRTSFGRFLRTEDRAYLDSALGHFARDVLGGSAVGSRRFGPAYIAGSDLYAVLSSLGGDGEYAAEKGLSRASLEGQSIDVVSERISEVLVAQNGDADRIKVAINEALFEVIGDREFDPARLDGETVYCILAEFLSQSIFQLIIEEVGDSWANGGVGIDPEAEGDILDASRVLVDTTLKPLLDSRLGLTRDSVHQFMKECVEKVLEVWESK